MNPWLLLAVLLPLVLGMFALARHLDTRAAQRQETHDDR